MSSSDRSAKYFEENENEKYLLMETKTRMKVTGWQAHCLWAYQQNYPQNEEIMNLNTDYILMNDTL